MSKTPTPPRPTPSPALTRRGAATRARIIETAADLIHAHGAERTSLDDVMEAGGFSKSQLYHYFSDKNALVLEVIRFQTERVLAAQDPHLGTLDSLYALKRWRDALLAINAAGGTAGCPLGSLASEVSNDFETARLDCAAGFAKWSGLLELGFARMQARGEIGPSADPHTLGIAVLSAVQGGLLLAKTARSGEPLRIALDMAIAEVARHTTTGAA